MIRYALPALILPALALLAGCATTPQERERAAASEARDDAKLAKQLAGFTPGTPVTCIDPRQTNVDVFGDTIVYRIGSNRQWVTRTNGGCFGLKRDDIIVTRSYGTRLCQGDIVRTVDRTSGFPSGACAFGEFVPYTRNRRR